MVVNGLSWFFDLGGCCMEYKMKFKSGVEADTIKTTYEEQGELIKKSLCKDYEISEDEIRLISEAEYRELTEDEEDEQTKI